MKPKLNVNKKQPKTAQQSLVALKRLWRTKLAKSGFVDAENDKGILLDWHSYDFVRPRNAERISATMQYNDLCLELLHTCKFDSPREHKIWELHCYGKSLRLIATELKISKSTAGNTISKYKRMLRLG